MITNAFELQKAINTTNHQQDYKFKGKQTTHVDWSKTKTSEDLSYLC